MSEALRIKPNITRGAIHVALLDRRRTKSEGRRHDGLERL